MAFHLRSMIFQNMRDSSDLCDVREKSSKTSTPMHSIMITPHEALYNSYEELNKTYKKKLESENRKRKWSESLKARGLQGLEESKQTKQLDIEHDNYGENRIPNSSSREALPILQFVSGRRVWQAGNSPIMNTQTVPNETHLHEVLNSGLPLPPFVSQINRFFQAEAFLRNHRMSLNYPNFDDSDGFDPFGEFTAPVLTPLLPDYDDSDDSDDYADNYSDSGDFYDDNLSYYDDHY